MTYLSPLKEPDIQDRRDEQSEENVDEYSAERRKRTFKEENWLYYVRVVFLLFTSLLTMGVVFTYVWHLIAPSGLRWMAAEDVDNIKDLAITIIVGLSMSVTTTYFFKNK